MRIKVLPSEKAKRHALKKEVVDSSFEEDWKNGISGKEVVREVHEHIKEWWSANRENKKA